MKTFKTLFNKIFDKIKIRRRLVPALLKKEKGNFEIARVTLIKYKEFLIFLFSFLSGIITTYCLTSFLKERGFIVERFYFKRYANRDPQNLLRPLNFFQQRFLVISGLENLKLVLKLGIQSCSFNYLDEVQNLYHERIITIYIRTNTLKFKYMNADQRKENTKIIFLGIPNKLYSDKEINRIVIVVVNYITYNRFNIIKMYTKTYNPLSEEDYTISIYIDLDHSLYDL